MTEVMARGEDDPLGWVLIKPLDSLIGQQRVDDGPRPCDEVAAHLASMARVDRVPVIEAGQKLLHGGELNGAQALGEGSPALAGAGAVLLATAFCA
jgi:hypothetical protein